MGGVRRVQYNLTTCTEATATWRDDATRAEQRAMRALRDADELSYVRARCDAERLTRLAEQLQALLDDARTNFAPYKSVNLREPAKPPQPPQPPQPPRRRKYASQELSHE